MGVPVITQVSQGGPKESLGLLYPVGFVFFLFLFSSFLYAFAPFSSHVSHMSQVPESTWDQKTWKDAFLILPHTTLLAPRLSATGYETHCDLTTVSCTHSNPKDLFAAI
jgi:hypothetical protein